MAVRKVPNSDMFDGIDYTYIGNSIDVQLINYPDEWDGICVGTKLPSGEVVQICTHHESGSAWVIVKCKDGLYEVDIPYEEIE